MSHYLTIDDRLIVGADHKKTEDSEADANTAAMKHDDEKYMATMKSLQFGKLNCGQG